MSIEFSDADILIVDDTVENLQLLSSMLEKQGFSVRPVPSGKLALQAAKGKTPDIVLLDINMPEMDGLEVCRRLRQDAGTKDVPIIFISALKDASAKVKAFEHGGVDYITKPFQIEEVYARVSVHLALCHARTALTKQNEILSENLRMREDIERITKHDLKNPLVPIVTLPRIIKKLGGLNERQTQFLDTIEEAGRQVSDIVNNSLNLYKMETGKYDAHLESVNLIDELGRVLRGSRNNAESKRIDFKIQSDGSPVISEDKFSVLGERLLLFSMLSNLLKNSIEASPPGETITISLNRTEKAIVSIHNLGAVPMEIRDHFFEKYATSGKHHGTGLGTYSAKLMAEAQQAEIAMETSEESGTTITIRFAFCDP